MQSQANTLQSITVMEVIQAEPAAASVPMQTSHAALGQKISRVLGALLMIVCSYYAISRFIVQSVTVVGVSMSPTLGDTQHYLLNKWILHVRSPRAMDIVVLRDPLDNGLSVKRVVAGNGDTVLLRGGSVYVNGRQLKETYLSPGTPTYPASFVTEQVFKCGASQYFVLGDNRNNSIDSRAYGAVPREKILGLILQ